MIGQFLIDNLFGAGTFSQISTYIGEAFLRILDFVVSLPGQVLQVTSILPTEFSQSITDYLGLVVIFTVVKWIT